MVEGLNREIKKFNVETQERWAIFNYPDNNDDRPSAAVLVFHGSTEASSPNNDDVDPLFAVQRFERNYDNRYFRSHRNSKGYAMVYLAARLEKGWYSWENNGAEFGSSQHSEDGNDEKFVQLISNSFRKSGLAVYAFGFSGGARFVWKYRDLFDAATPISGGLAPSLRFDSISACTPLVLFHGDNDSFNDIEESRDSFLWYKDVCHCQAPKTQYIKDQNVYLTQYENCDEGFYLHFYEIYGAGHTIPGAPFIWSGLGPTSSFNSLERMWYTWTNSGDLIPTTSSAQTALTQQNCSSLFIVWVFYYFVSYLNT